MKLGTLGPAGSNHDWVAARYLAFHGLTDDATVVVFPDFDLAFGALLAKEIDFVLQVAVHPSVTKTVAHYRERAHLVDTFLSPSQPMAVLTRRDVPVPTTLGLVTATQDYVDTSRWQTLVPASSTVAVCEGLLKGRYDSGITLSRFANDYPERLRVDETIGTVVDPWLVYAREAVCTDALVAWHDAPVRSLYASIVEPGKTP